MRIRKQKKAFWFIQNFVLLFVLIVMTGPSFAQQYYTVDTDENAIFKYNISWDYMGMFSLGYNANAGGLDVTVDYVYMVDSSSGYAYRYNHF